MAEPTPKPKAKDDKTGRTRTPEQEAAYQAERQIKDNERREAFKKIGGRRAGNAIKAIRLLHNLKGPGYVYTEDQVNKLVGAIGSELTELRAVLLASKSGPKEAITIDLD